MENTNNLKLPLLIPNQSGKEITHNEALIVIDNILQNGVVDKDLVTPPENPNVNDLYIVGEFAINEWENKDNQLAYYDNGWRFLEVREGATLWVNDEDCLYSFDGNNWIISTSSSSSGGGEGVSSLNELNGVVLALESQYDLLQHNGTNFINTKEVQNLSSVGINSTADSTNKLSVKSDAVLFDSNGSNSQIKVNKALETDIASHLFQTSYEGRAEFGLVGSDDFTLKVSNDGSTWNQSFVVDKNTGNIDFKGEITQNGESVANGSQNVWISSEYASAKNMFLEVQHNLNLSNVLYARCDVLMKCLIAEGGYEIGDYAINPITNTYESNYNLGVPLIPSLSANKLYFVTANDGLFMVNKSTGYRFRPTYSSWSLIFRIFY